MSKKFFIKLVFLIFSSLVFLTPTVALAALTQTDFSAGPIAGSAKVPATRGDFAFQGGFESSSNISYSDGHLSLADPTSNGEFISSPLDISSLAGNGSVYLYDLATFFENDFPPASNVNTDISVFYRVDGGGWKAAERADGQGVYQLYHQICTPTPGYPSCEPDSSSYSYAGSTVQYKLEWRGGNPPKTSLSKIREISIGLYDSSKKVASAAKSTSTSASRPAATTTVLQIDPPTLLLINEFKISDNPEAVIKKDQEIILSGRTYPDYTVRLYLADQSYEAKANNLGNWVYGFKSLPEGSYLLSAEAISAAGAKSEKKELYKFQMAADNPVAASSASVQAPQAHSDLNRYYLYGAGLLVLILLSLAIIFRRRVVRSVVGQLRQIQTLRLSKLLRWSLLALVLLAMSLLGYAYISADYYKLMASSAYDAGNYSLARDMYQRAGNLPIVLDKSIAAKSAEAAIKATIDEKYLSAINLSSRDLSVTSCAEINKNLDAMPKNDSRYEKSTDLALRCRLFIAASTINELYPDSVGDPKRMTVALSGTGKSTSSGGYNLSRAPSGVQDGFCSGEGELWNGFCLVGTEEWKNKIKEAITDVAAISPDRYATVQKYARTINMLPDYEPGSLPSPFWEDSTDYNPFPLGMSNCGNVISMRLNERVKDDQFVPATMNRLVEVVVHEADHGELATIIPHGCGSDLAAIHREMWNRWEATFNQQAAAWFASH